MGNGDGAGTEGACSGSVLGTYLHGPVLARNPWLADLLLALATGAELEPLDDAEELAFEPSACGRHHYPVAPSPGAHGSSSWRAGAPSMTAHRDGGPAWRPSDDGAAAATFTEVARWLVTLVGFIGPEQWDQPGLGEWNVRALVGHASRALVTVEEYLVVPDPAVAPGPADADGDADETDAVDGASRYFLGTHENPTLHAQVAARGRQAADELGASPAVGIGQLASRVIGLLGGAPPGSVFATRFGTLAFATYLHTRTVEIVVHGLDISAACELSLEVPEDPRRLTLEVMSGVARHRGEDHAVIRALGGRTALPAGFNLFG